MRVTKRFRNFRNHAFNNYLTWNVATGAVQHKLLLGYDHFNTQLAPGSSYIEAGGYLLANGGTTKTFKKADIAKYLLDKDGNPRTNVPCLRPQLHRRQSVSRRHEVHLRVEGRTPLRSVHQWDLPAGAALMAAPAAPPRCSHRVVHRRRAGC